MFDDLICALKYSLDHILEAQTVVHYINGPIDDKCKDALKEHLNAPENLSLLSAKNNQKVSFLLDTGKALDTFSIDVSIVEGSRSHRAT